MLVSEMGLASLELRSYEFTLVAVLLYRVLRRTCSSKYKKDWLVQYLSSDSVTQYITFLGLAWSHHTD